MKTIRLRDTGMHDDLLIKSRTSAFIYIVTISRLKLIKFSINDISVVNMLAAAGVAYVKNLYKEPDR